MDAQVILEVFEAQGWVDRAINAHWLAMSMVAWVM